VKLSELAACGRLLTVPDRGDLDVGGVTSDPAAVRPGDVFVVVGGAFAEARAACAEAVRRGAVAIVADAADAPSCEVPVLRAQDARRALAFMAAGFAGRVSALRLAGVTGTNGKSSTARLIQASFAGAGVRAAILETTNHAVGRGARGRRARALGAERTSEELAALADDGYGACAIEFSSISLAEGRAEGVPLGCAVFTSFGRDHLDYHGSTEEYLDAKLELFRLLAPTASAVINADDPASELFAEATRARVLTYGLDGRADVRGDVRRLDATGLDLDVRTPMGRYSLRSPLVGRASASNLLGALTAALSLGLEPEAALAGLRAVEAVPGRMERIDGGGPVAVFVDYAHNESSLEQALTTCRAFAKGRVIAVFGAGGDRPRGKRLRMGRAADLAADAAIVTSDNPRSENPADIIAAVVGGFSRLDRVEVELDRGAAIRRAVASAEPGDVVLIAGKGPETFQHVGDHYLKFEDAEAARDALRERGALG